jgi:hypothetical protein
MISRFLALAGVFLLSVSVSAAPPTVDYFFPAGSQRGKTVEITATGTFDRWPVDVWVDGKGVSAKAGKERGQLIVTVAADAVPGTYWVRLHDEQGASAQRPFVVGVLPEVLEKEPNDDPKQPQVLDAPNVTVNGKLAKDGDVDVFAVELRKGQTLVASMDAYRTLRSPMDGVLQLLSADGFVLAQNDDFHGIDPQITFTSPKDGRYLVRTFAFPLVPTAAIRFAGGDKFIYRLTLTTGGFADYTLPLAVARSAPGKVEVIGWNIPDAARKLPVSISVGADVATVFHPGLANAVLVRVEPHPVGVKSKTNSRQEPQPVALPFTVTGRLDKPGDVDAFQFAGKKGQKVALAIESRTLGFPLDPVLKVTDAASKVLTQVQAKTLGADVELDFTPSLDGPYRVEVHDFHGDGGQRFVYRLRALLAEPDFSLKVAGDRFALVPGKPLEIPIAIERRNGFGGEVEITALGLPKGVTAQAVTAPAGSKTATLRLTAGGDKVSGSFQIIGTAKGTQDLMRIARATLAEYGVATMQLWLTAGPDATVPKDAPPKKK